MRSALNKNGLIVNGEMIGVVQGKRGSEIAFTNTNPQKSFRQTTNECLSPFSAKKNNVSFYAGTPKVKQSIAETDIFVKKEGSGGWISWLSELLFSW